MSRTRSRPYLDSPRCVSSPLHRGHAVTPVRRPPKRRRLGRSALAMAKLTYHSSGSDDDSDAGVGVGSIDGAGAGAGTGAGAGAGAGAGLFFKGQPFQALTPSKARAAVAAAGGASSSASAAGRKPLARLKTTANRAASPMEEDTISPRKRKRSEPGSHDYDSGPNSPESGSWVETDDDEMPLDLIGEEDEHLIQSAPAYALHRLRKSELVRLWKVAGMWPDEFMDQDDPDLGKAQLVTGLISARTSSSTSIKSSSASHKSSRSGTSTLTSRPDTSDYAQDVEVTPKAARTARTKHAKRLADPIVLASARKERAKKAPRGRPARPLKARFGPNIQSPEQRKRPTTRSSASASSHYSTTDGSDENPGDRDGDVNLDVMSPPLPRRLRSHKAASTASNPSTHSTEDADAEDNDEDSAAVPSTRRRTVSVARRARHQRDAKRAALAAMGNEDESGSSEWEWEEASSPEPVPESPTRAPRASKASKVSKESKDKGPKASKEAKEPSAGGSPQKRRPSKSSRSKHEPMAVDDEESVRTTRSGKKFGDIRDDDDETMDEDEGDTHESEDFDLSTVTLSGLTRLKRSELVHLCEERNLELGGTKPQLARALVEWRDDQDMMEVSSTTSSQGTARPGTPDVKLVRAVASNSRARDGQTTPVLLRTHLHGDGPATPPRSDEHSQENDLNLDLQELGLEDFTIKPEYLVKLDKIGSGGFKDVYVGKMKGRKVAISEFRGHLSEMDIRELKLLAEFRHPNIVRFRGICIPEDSSHIPCMLISELCENGDLYDYIRNVPPPPLKRTLRLMLDIAKGLEYLHMRSPSIIHRDCKSTNILITRGGVAKVGDFGLARVKHSTRSMIRSLVGTVNWQAPELWSPAPQYDYKVDVFSAALVFWEMLSGWAPAGEKKYPWEGHNEHYIYDAVGQKHKRPSLAGLRKHWGAEPVNLVERMWHQDPRERPTMSDVVADLEALIAECK